MALVCNGRARAYLSDGGIMMNRRGFLMTTGAVAVARAVPIAVRPPARRILTLVYDKALGGMRAVERLVR